MNNFLEIESNPLDDLFGINLESSSEIDLSYLEQFASNTFNFKDELSTEPSSTGQNSSDSVTIYKDKSEYENALGPISSLIQCSEREEVHLEQSPTLFSSASPCSAESNVSFGSSLQSPTSCSSNNSSLHFITSPPPLTPIPPTPTPSEYQSPLYPNQPTQRFFPLDFNPSQVQSDGYYQNYTTYSSNLPQQWSPADCNSFRLKPVPAVGAIRRSRASRSRCPCLKCCSARINGLPSPSQHLCIIKNCQKSYSRPAHLRNHLKTHQNQSDLKCGICLRKFITSEMIISHMTDEHEADLKLF